MTEIRREKVSDASVWTAADLEADRSWDVRISDAECRELADGLAAVKAQGIPLAEMTARDFPLGPALRGLADRIVGACRDGRGFIVMRGFPVAGQDTDDIRTMYWGLSLHLGTCVSQDKHAALVADVIDRGQKKEPLTRAYGSSRESRLHVDLSDVVGLLCVRQAKESPPSVLASSMHVYNQFVEHHPEWLPRLYRGFRWDRFGEQAAWESPMTAEIPVFSHAGGQVSCRYNRSWITGASVRMNRPFDATEEAILDFFDQSARAGAVQLALHPGDMYFASNYTVLHGKAAHADEHVVEDAKRLLLRVWINLPDFRAFSDEATVRWGLTHHGNLGWTADELAAGKNLSAGNDRTLLSTPRAA